MGTPFPGMDPYLQQAHLWSDVHNSFLGKIREFLVSSIGEKYSVVLNQRVYVDVFTDSAIQTFQMLPDVAVSAPRTIIPSGAASDQLLIEPLVAEVPIPEEFKELFLEVREVKTGEIITVIELLSPTNKQPGSAGRREYESKRTRVLRSNIHFVEIDLILGGEPMPVRLNADRMKDYRILVSRWPTRPTADVFAFNLNAPIPSIRMPLKRGDQEPIVPLNQIMHELYISAGYRKSIDYSKPSEVSLSAANAQWVQDLLRDANLTPPSAPETPSA